MSSRYVPYATSPARLLTQVLSDIVAVVWTVIWVSVGLAVHRAVATISDVGKRVHDGADGLAQGLVSAGHGAGSVPLVGGTLSTPLRAAGNAATDLAGAGASLDSTASWLAWVLGLAVALPPILAVAMPWLLLRLRFFRHKWTTLTLASTAAGEQLLALRALANRPMNRLTEISADPVAAWQARDATAVRRLAALELRAAGIRLTRR